MDISYLNNLLIVKYLYLEPETIKFYRYEDPIMGERTMPEFGQPLKDKILIPDNAAFEIDADSSMVFVVSNDTKHHIGRTVTYLIR